MLSKASKNLGATLVLMKDAREKFDTIVDCEPAIDRLHRGVVHMQNEKSGKNGGKKATAVAARHNPFGDKNSEKEKNVILTEQDVYSAADSMEIIRDAYEYFMDRRHWRSTPKLLSSLERVHEMGVSSMCILESFHLMDSGQAVRIKRVVKQEGESQVTPANETAQQVCVSNIFQIISFVSTTLSKFSTRLNILCTFDASLDARSFGSGTTESGLAAKHWRI